MKPCFFHFAVHENQKGKLTAVESRKDIPFPIRRVYYLYEVAPDQRRGFHAHRNLEQILICVHGSCKILLDNGREKSTVILDNPAEGLYIGNTIWREMFDFSPGTVLLVLASNLYTEEDYIRNYDAFLDYLAKEEMV